MWFTVDKLPLVGCVRKPQEALSMPFTLQPLSFVDGRPFFDSHPSDFVVNPGPFVDPSICVVVDTLSALFSLFHLSLIPLPIFFDVNALSVVEIAVPLSQVDVAVTVLEDTCS